MPKRIDQLRSSPEFAGLNDEAIVQSLALDYPEVPLDKIRTDLGVVAPPTATPGRTLGSVLKDVGVSAAKGVVGVGESLVGLGDMASGGGLGNVLQDTIGYRPAVAQQMLQDQYSPAQQAAFREVQNAEGFTGKLGAALTNPSTIAHSVIESVPAMLGGGAAARGILKVLPAIGPLTAAALGEGASMAGNAAETIRQQTGGLTGSQTLDAAAIGAAGAGFAMLGGKIAKKLGIADIDTMIAAGKANPAAAKGLVRRVLEGAFSEGVLEELPQSIAEQAIQNKALGKPIEDGIDQAAVMGLLAGAAMGGGANVIHGTTEHAPPPQNTPPGTPPPAAPVDPNAGPLSTAAAMTPGATPAETTPGAEGLKQAVTALAQAGAEPVTTPEDQRKTTANTEAIGAGVAPMPVHPVMEDEDPFSKPIQRPTDRDAEIYNDVTGGTATSVEHPTAAAASPELQAARDLITAVDAGGIPLNPAKLRKVAEGLGLEVSTSASPEETVSRIRAALAREEEAHQAAPSPLNDRPEPTDGQKEAGNYKKGHIKFKGLDISIENPKGSTRTGKRPDGTEWSHDMSDHYGYIKRTKGADDEQVDVYVGPREDVDQVYVVDQVNQHDGSFDEHKVMLGFANRGAAINAYRKNFDAGWKVGRITEMPIDGFKEWLANGDLKKPASPAGALNVTDQDAEENRYKAAVDVVRAPGGKASVSLVQRKLGVGYNTAARLLERMEKEGIVGPMDDKGGREILAPAAAPAAPSPGAEPVAAPAPSPGVAATTPAQAPAAPERDEGVQVDNMRLPDLKRPNAVPLASIDVRRMKDGTFASGRSWMADNEGYGTAHIHHTGFKSVSEAVQNAIDDLRKRVTSAMARGEGQLPPLNEAAGQKILAWLDKNDPRGPAKAPAPTPAPAAPSSPEGTRWDGMSKDERMALLAGTKSKNPQGTAGKAWADLSPGWHSTITRLLQAPPAPAAAPAPASAPTPSGPTAEEVNAARAKLPDGYRIDHARAGSSVTANSFTVTRPDNTTLVHGLSHTQAGLDEAVRAASVDAQKRSPAPAESPATPPAPPAAPPAVDSQGVSAGPAPAPAPPKTTNTVFTDDMAAAARARLKAKLGRLNSGLDPQDAIDGIILAGWHIEKGARSFAAFAKAMLADMGDSVRPYLKSWYMAVRYDPRAAKFQAEMSSPAMVEEFNVADVDTPAESSAPAEAPAAPTAEKTLTRFFTEYIDNGNMPRDNPALRKMVELYDQKPATPERMKQAQEALEAAIVMRARILASMHRGNDARPAFDAMLALYESQPNLNVRTSTSVENQAYSTPAPLAFLASRLAGIQRDTSVLEPTAGTGMLLMEANPKNATVNELNPERAELLREQGFNPSMKDAATESLRHAGYPVDAVIANPPFGGLHAENGKTRKELVDGYQIGQIDHLIAARALAAMKPDGRAVLIIGADKVAGGMSEDSRIFFNWLYSHYTVSSHFEVDGKLYTRQGASWPVRVITITGRADSDAIAPKAGTIQRVDTWEQVYEQFTNALAASRQPDAAAAPGARSGGQQQTRPKPVSGPAVATPAVDGGRQPPSSPSSDGNVAGAGTGTVGTGAVRGPRAVGPRPDASGPDEPMAGGDRLGQAGSGVDAPAGNQPAGGAGNAARLTDADNAFQTKYTPRSSRKDEGVLVPVNMAQPLQDALSTLEDAVGDLDEFVTKELGYDSVKATHDALMGLQVDSVAAGIHQIKNRGKALIIADQTGIGKGRQAAALIRWAVRNGRTPVFFTVKPQLFTDMYVEDLRGINDNGLVQPFVVNIDEPILDHDNTVLFETKPAERRRAIESMRGGVLPGGHNAVFITYSQINTENSQRDALRGIASNAVFILDESHNAGGESNTGEYIKELLEVAAGTVYLSATYAKRPDNMPLYFKTDIGEAVADDTTLMDAMASGGLPLQTVVSNNLVKAGQMFRRERSYDGISIRTTIDTERREEHEKLSDATTEALRGIVAADRAFHEIFVKNLKDEVADHGHSIQDVAGNQAAASVEHSQFSSVVHNFVRQMLLGLNAQNAADAAIAALKAGQKPLIALENTMGSFLVEYAANHGIQVGQPLGDFTYRTVLSRALDRTRYVVEKDAQGNKTKRHIPLDALDPATRAMYDAAQAVIDDLNIDIPVSPIDWIRQQIVNAGHSVAEITGRSLAVDYTDPKKPRLAEVPKSEQNDKVGTTRHFNGMKEPGLDMIVLNVSGSTGISLHASEKFKDQAQRKMIVAQAAQDINILMQMLGRIHRTGQVRLPEYEFLNPDLPAVRRPMALTSKKMKSLNANTSSNTESATSLDAVDMMNKYGDRVIAEYLADNPSIARDMGLKDFMDENGKVKPDLARSATGKLALMPVAVQKQFYEEVEAQYNTLIDYLNKTNQNELEPRTYDFDAKELKTETLFKGQNPDSPFGQDAIYGEYSIKSQGKPMTPAEIKAEIKEHLGGKTPVAHTTAILRSLEPDFDKFFASLDEDQGEHKVLVQNVRSKAIDFIESHAIGHFFRIDIKGDSFNAVVTNLRSTHKAGKPGNPYSLSKIQVSVAVNGGLRHLTMPATQFERIEVASIGPNYSVDQLFRESAQDREVAKIVTGNLLAAFGELQGTHGTIISFTKQDGTSDLGILLPKAFTMAEGTKGGYRLKDGAQAVRFLHESDAKDIDKLGIATRDSALRITPARNGGIMVRVPKSKSKGGKYFLDPKIRAVTGDFVTVGDRMVVEVPSSNAAAAVDALMKKGAIYALPSHADQAQAMFAPQVKFDKNGKPRLEDGGGKPAFRQDGNVPAGAHQAAVLQAAMDDITAGWQNAPEVIVLPSVTSGATPAAIRNEARTLIARGGSVPSGAWHDGRVYLFADRIRDEQDAAEVLFHEALGHMGLRGAFGDALEPILRQIASVRRAEVAAIMRRNGFQEGERLRAAEEYLAEMAQTRPTMGFVQRAIAAIKTFLRKMGVLKAENITDEEIIRSYILPARSWVERGVAGKVAPSAAFSAGPQPFYSALERGIRALPDKALNSVGWTGALNALVNKGQAKADEVEWSGVKDWLALQEGRITKDAVLEYLAGNGVRISETMLGTTGGFSATSELNRLTVEADAQGWIFDRERFNSGDEYSGRNVQFQDARTGTIYELEGDNETSYLVNVDKPSDTITEGSVVDIARSISQLASDEQEDVEENGTRYDRYTEPGGTNYRELLLTLPPKPLKVEIGPMQPFNGTGEARYNGREAVDGVSVAKVTIGGNEVGRITHWPKTFDYNGKEKGPKYVVYTTNVQNAHYDSLEAATAAVRQDAKTGASEKHRSDVFTTRHWPNQRNVIAHIRVKDRVDADGKRVLFVEELQSDWAQAGRKNGFATTDGTLPEGWSVHENKESLGAPTWYVVNRSNSQVGHYAQSPELAIASALNDKRMTVARAPFVEGTQPWVNLALKRVLKLAADEGYDRVAFANGEQNVKRYSLDKHITKLMWKGPIGEGVGNLTAIDKSGREAINQRMPSSQVEEYVGKEIADRLLHESTHMQSREGVPLRQLEGLSLKTGGAGMRAFYDTIVPTAISKMLPKLGGEKLATVVIPKTESRELPAAAEIKSTAWRFVHGEIDAEELIGELGIEGVVTPAQVDEWLPSNMDQHNQHRSTGDVQAFTDFVRHSAKGGKTMKQTGFDVTPAMREKLRDGLPLFSSRPGFTFNAEQSPLYKERTAAQAGAVSEADAAAALQNDATARRILAKGIEVQDGDRVGSRLNINVFKSTGVAVNTVHKGKTGEGYKQNRGWWSGEVLTYQPVVTLRDAYFNVGQTQRERIAAGEGPKEPMASVDGLYVKGGDNFNGVEFRFNPKREHLFRDGLGRVLRRADEVTITGHSAFARGNIEYYGEEDVPARAGEAPTQGRLLEPGDDSGTPLFSQGPARSMRDYWQHGMGVVQEFAKTPGKLNWWQKTFGTPYDLAQRKPAFKRVYDRVQDFLRDVSLYATEAADLAPRILPKLDSWKDAFKKPLSAADTKAIQAPIFEGTLKYARDRTTGKPILASDLEERFAPLDVHQRASMLVSADAITADDLKRVRNLPIATYEAFINRRFEQEFMSAGIVWKDDELRSMYHLNDEQIGLYREARKSIDKSLTDLTLSHLLNFAGKDARPIADTVMEAGSLEAGSDVLREYLMSLAPTGDPRSAELTDTAARIVTMAQRGQRLIDRGYAPLSRFGKYTVDVLDTDGERVFFGMYESRVEARRMAAKMRDLFPGATVSRGTASQQGHELFRGMTPETAELFGEMLGLTADGEELGDMAFQKFLKEVKAPRSAMKRLIERKGIEGFSEDVGRVLASFIYSNARQTANNLHAKQIAESVTDIDEKTDGGELKDAAVRLMKYVMEPAEEAPALRQMLFAQYLGGSVAAMLVNMTQPFAVTAPYLTQWTSIGKVRGLMSGALRDVWKDTTGDVALDRALRRAAEEGIVAPQEVHQLMAQARGKATLASGDGTAIGGAQAWLSNTFSRAAFLWGQPFAIAELFNRRLTFIAAYRLAVANDMPNPAAFAEKAINDTQFTYNKGNRPEWARGPVGSMLFTFKQYSISYLELVTRMWSQGGKEGKQAALLMLAMLLLMGGAGGLPFMEDISDLIDGVGQRMGYNMRSKHARQQFLERYLGQTLGGIADRGITGLPGMPIDVAARFGMGNLIPGTGLLTKKTDHTRDVVEILGPGGDMAARAFQGANQAADGKPVTGLLTASPKAIGNWQKAIQMATLGYYPDSSPTQKKVVDTTAGDVIAKALGFQPAAVARVQEATRDVEQLKAVARMKESEIADKWAMGVFSGDQAAAQSAKEELAAWNRDNPDSPIRIQPRQIRERVRKMRQPKEERVASTAPKEIRAEVRKELAEARR